MVDYNSIFRQQIGDRTTLPIEVVKLTFLKLSIGELQPIVTALMSSTEGLQMSNREAEVR
jgi:hypothetical protein